jgi:drug/metabolite transporter (DMT)-like permease
MSWIGLSILAAFIWAIVNLLDKLTLTKWTISPILPVLLMGLMSLIVSVGIFIFYPIHLLPFPLMVLAFLAGSCYFATTYFYCYAVKWEDLSKVVPLLYLTPLWIALIAHFFLNENLSVNQYMGIGLLIAGAILISVKKLEAPGLNKALLGAVLACVFFAINQVITKYILQHADVLTTFSHVRFSTFLAAIPFFLLHVRHVHRMYKENGPAPFVLDAGSQILNVIGLFVFVSAASVGYVTLTNALVAIQPFFVLLFVLAFSHFYPLLLEEKFDKQIILKKIVATILMFSGVALLQS